MNTLTPKPTHRPKKVVRYGKASSRSSYNANNIGDFMYDDGPASPPPPPPSSSTKPSGTPAAIPTQEVPIRTESPEAPLPLLRKEKERRAKPREREMQPADQKPEARKHDAFDVPSSDDEVDVPVPVKRTSPPKMKKRNVLVDDRGVDEEMAPWERKRGSLKPTMEKTKTPKKEDPKQKPPTSNTAPTETKKTRRNDKDVESSHPAPSTAEPPPTTAAARLAARRQRANGEAPTSKSKAEAVPATKRPGLTADSNISNPRKRARRSPPPAQVEASEDVDMKDAPDSNEKQIPIENQFSSSSKSPSSRSTSFIIDTPRSNTKRGLRSRPTYGDASPRYLGDRYTYLWPLPLIKSYFPKPSFFPSSSKRDSSKDSISQRRQIKPCIFLSCCKPRRVEQDRNFDPETETTLESPPP
ncbi:hypothetical protein KC365_g10256 [Hortaea werneckii]|nr:hypothetical protein KC365_g10256 [Hortaea werneckii]